MVRRDACEPPRRRHGGVLVGSGGEDMITTRQGVWGTAGEEGGDVIGGVELSGRAEAWRGEI